jgi:hypothetical protein
MTVVDLRHNPLSNPYWLDKYSINGQNMRSKQALSADLVPEWESTFYFRRIELITSFKNLDK